MNLITNPNAPPSLADLTYRFVNRSVDVATIEAETAALGEVEPHEVAVGFRTDPRMAWNEGLAALNAFGLKNQGLLAPPEWSAIVVRHDAIACQPFALVNYPQRVRDLTALLQAKELKTLLPRPDNRSASISLRTWAGKQVEKHNPLTTLVAAAVLRAGHDLEQAETLLLGLRSRVPESLGSALGNEEAALAWQKGDIDRAAARWDGLPDNAVTHFNRGMAALFVGRATKARESLKKAVGLIPETDGWLHLASLYLALAEMH